MLRACLAVLVAACLASACAAEDAKSFLLRHARQDLLAGHARRALDLYRKAPDCTEARLGEALCLVRLHDFDLARRILHDLIRVIPDDAELAGALHTCNEHELRDVEDRLHRGHLSRDREGALRKRLLELYEIDGHFLAARDRLLAESPIDWKGAPPVSRFAFERRLQLARLFRECGQRLEAGETYEHAAPGSPDPRATLLAAVDEYAAAHDYDRAHELLDRLAEEKTDQDVELRLAAVALHTGLLREALRLYEHYPAVVEARLGLALCLVELKRFDEARPVLLALTASIPADPQLVEALRTVNEREIEQLEDRLSDARPGEERFEQQERLLTLYELNGHFESVEALTVAIAHRRPLKFGERLRLARAFAAQFDFRRAGKAFEAAAEKSPDPRTTLLAAANAFLAAEDCADAARVLAQLDRFKGGADLDVSRGTLAWRKGDLGAAQRLFERHPEDAAARRGLGLVLLLRHHDAEARPLLVEAGTADPSDVEVRKALREANQEQIEEVERELPRFRPGTEHHRELEDRLLDLYELQGQYEEARELILHRAPLHLLPPEDLVRVAALFALTGRPQRAAQIYERVAPATLDPRATWLAVADQRIAAEQYGFAEEALSHAERLVPGEDCEERRATIAEHTSRFTEAQEIRAHLAHESEAHPYAGGDPHVARLRAVDLYLEAHLWTEAQRVIEKLRASGGGKDVDLRQARVLAAREHFQAAEDIYRRYPRDPAVRAELAYTLLAAGHVDEARHEFELLRFDDPTDRVARAGYRTAQEAGPTNIAAFGSSLDYGSVHGVRQMNALYVRNTYARAVTTLVYEHTMQSTPGADGFSFQEDQYGAKLDYRLNPKNTLEGEVFVLRNNDSSTNNGSAVGLRYYHTLDDRWIVGAGYGRSDYHVGSTTQATLYAGYRFDRRVRFDATAMYSNLFLGSLADGSGSNAALKAAVTWQPRRRLFAVGTVFAGRRELTYDADDMFVFNTTDVFSGGFSVLVGWQAAHQARVFAKASSLPFQTTTGTSATEAVTTFGADISF